MLLTRKKLQMKQEVQFALKGEYITLDALMKAAGLAGTGGEAIAVQLVLVFVPWISTFLPDLLAG